MNADHENLEEALIGEGAKGSPRRVYLVAKMITPKDFKKNKENAISYNT